MPNAIVRSKGQITLPKEVRKTLGLKAGHRVSFRIREDKVVELRPENVDLMSLFGIFKPRIKGVTLEDMNGAIREGASGQAEAEGDPQRPESLGVCPASGFMAP